MLRNTDKKPEDYVGMPIKKQLKDRLAKFWKEQTPECKTWTQLIEGLLDYFLEDQQNPNTNNQTEVVDDVIPG